VPRCLLSLIGAQIATIFAPTLFTAGISATEPLVLKQIFDALSGASVFADIAAGAVLLFLLVRS
jgi:hypothetical protein